MITANIVGVRKFSTWMELLIFCCTGMIGYGMAKAAIHQLVQSLASEGGGLPNNASALAILP